MQRRCQSPRDSLWGEPLIPPPAWHSATQSGLWRGLWEIGENDPSLYLTVLFCEDLVHTITNCVKQTNKKARKEVMRGFISVFFKIQPNGFKLHPLPRQALIFGFLGRWCLCTSHCRGWLWGQAGNVVATVPLCLPVPIPSYSWSPCSCGGESLVRCDVPGLVTLL